MIDYAFEVIKYDDDKKQLIVQLDEHLNVERLNTAYSGDLSRVNGQIILTDPRRFTSQQRRLYRALLGDIKKWSGTSQLELHDYFKDIYYVNYELEISTANTSNNTISEVHKLIELVIDFMFEWDVPFAKSFEILPKEEQYFFYLCAKHRKCAVCGASHADIHHLVAVGNRKRKQVDHRKLPLVALCRTHHNQAHNDGVETFMSREKIYPVYLNSTDLIKIGIMNMSQIKKFDEREN